MKNFAIKTTFTVCADRSIRHNANNQPMVNERKNLANGDRS